MSEPTQYCRSLAGKLNDIIDGDADPGLVKEATAHVKECDWCRGEYEQLVTLVEECHKGGKVDPGSECRKRLKNLFKEFKISR